MDVLKITLNEEGRVSHFAPDFKVMRGAYGNILINVEVPKALLVDAVYEDNVNITGNNIRIAAIIRTATGRNLKTKKFELSYVKDFTRDSVEYRLYQRKCPKVFTMWETVSLIETATNGLLELVINVVNWSLDENGARIEESWPSQIVPVDVYAGEYLDEGEELENPSDFELLQGQVQEESARQQEIDASLFGTDADTLGTYLLERLIAGNKITIQKDTANAPNNQIKISVETIKASEVPIKEIEEILSDNVQGALEELNKRTNSKNIDSVTGIDEGMVDNTDPYNPIILHDPTKADDKRVDDEVAAINNAMTFKADLVEGKVPSSQLPSYVDDTIEVETFDALPAVGETGKIYVVLVSNLTYRWSGTTYVEISKSLAIGETENTAYRGDRGKVAYDHSQTKGNPHNTTKADVGLSNVDNTSDKDKPVSDATQQAIENVANSIPTKVSQLEQDASHRTVSDSQITQWNNNSVILYSATGENTDGAMTQKAVSDALKEKQAGIEKKADTTNPNQSITAFDIILQGVSMFDYCANLGQADTQNVKITGDQDIAGTKNFKGTFKINGGTISYDASTDTFTI